METADVIEPAASPELGTKMVGTVRKVREAILPVYWLQNVGFRELVDGDKLLS